MPILAINDRPTIQCGYAIASFLEIVPTLDYLVVWADVNDGRRFRITISRGYADDAWNAPWREDVLLAAFEEHKAEVCAEAEVALRAGKRSLDLD